MPVKGPGATALAILATIAMAAVAASALVPQEPAAGRPQSTFKSAVDLVPVDVNVVDRDGRPVDNLTPADFTLAVDGKPRKIASAEFIKLTSAAAAPPPAATHFSTNAAAANGRLIMLVVDQGNIAFGRARQLTESASRFIKRLGPSDRVGLFAIPGPGVRINFTANHALLLASLPRIVGQASARPGLQRVGIGEAIRIERGEQTAMSAVADRECTGTDRGACILEIEAEARELVVDARTSARNSIRALRGLLEQLSDDQTPKTVVFLSEGLVIDNDRSELAWVGPLASKGRIALHVLRIEAAAADAGMQRRMASRSEDAAASESGLSMLAGLARGSLFRVIGNAENIFNRVALEMSAYYLLGFEAEPGDRDGKPHRIKIEVPDRRGIEVRSRPDFTVEPPRTRTDEQALTETLRSPLLATGIGLKVTTYTFREADSRKLKIVIAADIDRSQNPTGNVAVGYALMDPRGALVSSLFEPQVKAPIRGESPTQSFVAAAAADEPGVYGLKVAVIDDSGKRGSVEHAFRAQLTQAGPVRTGDLLLAEGVGSAAGVAPAVSGDLSDPESLNAFVELYADSAEAFKDASVTLEVAARGDSRALQSVAGRFDEASSTASRRIAEGALPIALLPPGEYQARAVINIAGRKAAQVTRPFRVMRSAAIDSTVASDGRARSRAAAPFTLRVDPFQRATVLTPQVVGFFLDRMGAGNGTAVPAEAIEHARGGRFDQAQSTAQASGHTLASVFLQGMALYAKGEMEAAAVKFRESLRIDSEFFPAAFYLGACYAAGGRDREASAAWQTSLVTESDAPFVYTLLGDALLRLRAVDRAMDILDEAIGRWPDDPQLQWRRGAALAMKGNAQEAIEVLDKYLSAHPADTERVFLALRVIYEAHAAGRTLRTAAEDRARFDRYAAAYVAAGGTQLPLVEQWKKFMERR